MEPIVDPALAKQAAGPLGALSAMLFMRGPWPQRLAMLVPGMALSFYGAGPLAVYLHMPEGLSGFLLGLFGMAAVGKVFDTWESLQLGDLLRKRIAALLGVKEGSE